VNKAVFLDRDGVVNNLVFNSKSKEFEPPFEVRDFVFKELVLESLQKLYQNDYKLFIISNQPDYAKGKTTLENLHSVHSYFQKELEKNGIFFNAFNYCYHHSNGIVKEYSFDCDCRKPKTYFVEKSVLDFNIDKTSSWFIGDRDSDIICGSNSGLKTILVLNNESESYTGNSKPDFTVRNLQEAVNIITE
jgi:D-glycero-D-manno-heptose 1,7-bisphosphate phosphatase